MRWAIGFLVVINVTIFLWGNLTQSPATMGRGTTSLAAASGLEIPPLTAPVQSAVADLSVSSLGENAAAGDPVDTLPPLPFGTDPDVQKVPAPEADEKYSGVESDEDIPSQHTAAIPGAPVSDNAQPSSAHARRLVSTEITAAAPDMATGGLHCGQIGPVSRASDAESVRSRLDEAGLQPILQEVVKSENKGFWVLIPPLADRREGEKTLAKLRSKGVKDMWLFKRGELNNAISLGLYNRRNNAESRQQRLLSLGFDVEVWPRVEPVSHFQVSFSGNGPAVLDQVRRLIPRFESRDHACTQATVDTNEL